MVQIATNISIIINRTNPKRFRHFICTSLNYFSVSGTIHCRDTPESQYKIKKYFSTYLFISRHLKSRANSKFLQQELWCIGNYLYFFSEWDKGSFWCCISVDSKIFVSSTFIKIKSFSDMYISFAISSCLYGNTKSLDFVVIKC